MEISIFFYLLGFLVSPFAPGGPNRYKCIESINLFNKYQIYNEQKKESEISFACDQWYFNPNLYPHTKLKEEDCNKIQTNKVKIVGENQKSVIGQVSNDLYLFSPIAIIKERILVEQTINQHCTSIIYTYTTNNNYENANKFLKSTKYLNEFNDSCFELHFDLHFMKEEIKINGLEYIFNIRSSLVYLSFHKEYKKEKNKRFILKAIGTKKIDIRNENQTYPHYLAFQLE